MDQHTLAHTQNIGYCALEAAFGNQTRPPNDEQSFVATAPLQQLKVNQWTWENLTALSSNFYNKTEFKKTLNPNLKITSEKLILANKKHCNIKAEIEKSLWIFFSNLTECWQRIFRKRWDFINLEVTLIGDLLVTRLHQRKKRVETLVFPTW